MRQFAVSLSALATRWGDEDRQTRRSRDLADRRRRGRDDRSDPPATPFSDEDVALNRRIGEAGLPLIESLYRRLGRPANILTQCNVGRLATVE
jgi:methylthioribose-1-phosphate isomerase